MTTVHPALQLNTCKVMFHGASHARKAADTSYWHSSLPVVLQSNQQHVTVEEIQHADEMCAALNFRNAAGFATDASDVTGVHHMPRALGMQVICRLGARAVWRWALPGTST